VTFNYFPNQQLGKAADLLRYQPPEPMRVNFA
jgi:hypothetical protein